MIVLATFVSLFSGCGRETGKRAEEARAEDAKAVESEVERGPVRLTVRVEPARPRLSDEPTLTVIVDYEKGVTIEKPPFGESLGDFVIRDFREPLPRVEGDREILEQVYTLEPTRSGELAVWPIPLTFTDTRADGDGKEHTIQTEGLTVEVESVVDSEAPSLGELRPAAGPMELPEVETSGLWWLVGVLAAAIAGAVLLWRWRKRRRRIDEVQQLSPRELAYLELERLLEQELAERDVKRFYVELTGLVRRYIERTTGILAPEQTTEEFLAEISREETFAPDERGRLGRFLESADLVKFAAYEPRKEDLQESFERAKAFVGLSQTEVAA